MHRLHQGVQGTQTRASLRDHRPDGDVAVASELHAEHPEPHRDSVAGSESRHLQPHHNG